MNSTNILLLLLFSIIAKCSFSYKVLIYSPTLYYSHVKFMNTIADILAEAGNDVVPKVFSHFYKIEFSDIIYASDKWEIREKVAIIIRQKSSLLQSWWTVKEF